MSVPNLAMRGNKMTGRQRAFSKPRVSVYRLAGLSIVTATPTTISWDTVDYDVEGMWNSTSPTLLTCRTAGLWAVNYLVTWDASATGIRDAYISKNQGASFYGRTDVFPSSGGGALATQNVSAHIVLNAKDTLQLVVTQTSGGGLAFIASATPFLGNGLQACLISTIP